jgi:peptidoglycan/xylan/chitin deacetylase (PgdA/CDA1 family)
MYHRVTDLESDPWSLAVTPRRFAQHLEVLRKLTRPMPLGRLSRALLDGTLPNRSVVVTFDDGYADNLHNAKPLLERYGIPATFFLTTGFVGHEREFWSDELERILLQPGTLPEKLCLSVGGNTCHWNLGKAARYGETAWRSQRHWRAWEAAPSSRHSLYRSLWELLYLAPEEEQRTVLRELREWAEADPTARSDYRSLALEEVVALAQGEMVEIGAHTVTHPPLSALPVTSQRDEIRGSRAWLEGILDRPVTSFAYPYGDLSAEAIGVVRELGFACACSTRVGTVDLATDRFQLPRVHAHDWKGNKLAKLLSRSFVG